MKSKWDEKEFFSHLSIPDTWENLEAFADWYMESKMPMRIPFDSYVYNNDNATAITLFRHKNFQVEKYITYPGATTVEEHFHPGMEVITMQIGKMNHGILWGAYSDPLLDGESHDGNFASPKGCVFLTFERWENRKNMTSAMVNWKGKTVGPQHDALIKKFYPNSFVENGYADVTQTVDNKVK